MGCLERFKTKMNYQYQSLHNEDIYNSKLLTETVFKNDPSYQTQFYFWNVGDTDKSYDEKSPLDIRVYNREFSDANGFLADFQTLLKDDVSIGDVLYDRKSNTYWIIKTCYNLDDIHWQGKLNRCNWILKWQNKELKILEYPCYVRNSTQYNSGESSNNLMTIGSTQRSIMLPYDENTVVLQTPQRFYLDRDEYNPTPFKVTSSDTLTYNYDDKGIVMLMALECAEDEKTDRPDLGICDYIEPVTKEESEILYTTDRIISGGDSQTFTAQFSDSSIVPKWTINCDNDLRRALEVKESGNTISIGIDDDDFIDEQFKLILTDENNQYKSELLITIDSLF